jgi:large subunit ribosomal protein L28
MAKFCEVCQKGAMNGNKVSHSNRKSGRFLLPNVQSVRALVDNKPQRVSVCTRCLRSGKVVRALPRMKTETAEA